MLSQCLRWAASNVVSQRLSTGGLLAATGAFDARRLGLGGGAFTGCVHAASRPWSSTRWDGCDERCSLNRVHQSGPNSDRKIIAMYARRMTVREIKGYLLETYVSPDLISKVTDEVMTEVTAQPATRADASGRVLEPRGRSSG